MEAGLSGRPLWSELVKVTSGELIFRRVRLADIKDHMPPGARVQTSAMQTNECTPNPKNYGPSVFVKALLANGVEDLRARASLIARRMPDEPEGTQVYQFDIVLRGSQETPFFVEGK